MPRTVWGTAVVAPTSPDLHASLPRDDELRDDGWLQGWERDLMDHQQDTALAASMDGLEVQASKQAAGGKKGKKGKKITLMSTASGRRGA